MSDLESGFVRFVKWVWRDIAAEIAQIANPRQRLAAKANAAFGLVAAFIVALLFASSVVDKFVSLIEVLAGHDVGKADIWVALIAFLSLLGYFACCVLIIAGLIRLSGRSQRAS